ncbi:tetratricopeptide repeat protein [Candidatus Parabeggiatoa sp. HSG14]|uniref:tetratricopeptide repeat protein n=1 Tax=Candidatus Parabeggiatoa sp. HSG14 TaxID=3055593 RepID=UPI0025A6A0C6|nr:tetratricopeptide repeat protein [Thiotrichales bacterium HSG14]
MKKHLYVISVFTLLTFSVFSPQSIGGWWSNDDSETPPTENSETQTEDSSNSETQTEEPSYWESLKNNITEKAKTIGEISGMAKDNIVEKAKVVGEISGTAKDNIVEKAKAVGELSGIAKDNIAEKAKNLLTDTKEMRFEDVYETPFWKNDTVFWSAIAVASAGAAVFTVYTGGTGAPAAGTGVSYVASQLVAGGGAGSYMSGLSTVGAWFGGNAITGAAILNAGSAGILGYGGKAATIKGISATTKLVLASTTNFGKFGFMYLSLEEASDATPIIQILPSGDFGTGKVEELLVHLKEANNKLTEVLAKNEETRKQLNVSFNQTITVINEKYQDTMTEHLQTEMVKQLTQLRELNNKIITEKKAIEAEALSKEYKIVIQKTHEMIDNYLTNKASSSKEMRSDAAMGAVLLHSLGYKKEFANYIKQFKAVDQNESFLLYLKAIAHLIDKDFKVARQYALQAIDAEPEAIEPVMVLIMALDGLGQYQQALEVEILLEENFDDNHYETPNSLITAYNLLGDIANAHQLPQTAAKFHKKAFDNMSYFSDDDEKAFICLKIANDYHVFGSKSQSTEYYKKAISYVEDDNLKQEINRFFEKEVKTQLVLN